MTRPLALLLGCFALACSESNGKPVVQDRPQDEATCRAWERRTEDGACVAYGWKTCGEGFVAGAAGYGCDPILPPAACPPGTLATPGSTACAAIGWRSCPAGFALDPAGSGCVPRLPASRCAGATRESVGNPSCVPVGDCAAPFPPSDATLFVDDSYAAGQLDATHFATLDAAVKAAPSGAVIAVEAGNYPQKLAITKQLRIFGRCAEKVRIVGSSANGPGVGIVGTSVRLENVTLGGFDTAMYVEAGAQVVAENVVVEKATRLGIAASDSGTSLKLSRSVVRLGLADGSGRFGQGIAAAYGAHVELDDVALTDNRENGLFAQSLGTEVVARRLLVAGTLPRGATGQLGWGVGVQRQARVTLEESAVIDNLGAGVEVAESGSEVTVRRSFVARTRKGLDTFGKTVAGGVVASLAGKATVEESLVADVPIVGLYAGTGGSVLIARDVTVLRSGETSANGLSAGVWVERASTGVLERVLVAASEGLGVTCRDKDSALTAIDLRVAGVTSTVSSAGWGVSVREQARLTATRLQVGEATEIGIGIHDGSSAVLSRVLVEGTRLGVGYTVDRFGMGVDVDASKVALSSAVVRATLVVGVAVSGRGSLAVSDTLVEDVQTSVDGTRGYGFAVQTGGLLDVARAGVRRAHTIGVFVTDPDSALTARELTVEHTEPQTGGRDRGWGAQVQVGGRLALDDSLLLENSEVGAYAVAASLSLTDSAISGVATSTDRQMSHGIIVTDEGGVLRLLRARVERVGTALVFAGGAGTVQSSQVRDNRVGVHAQFDSTLSEADAVPDALATRQVVISRDTTFVDNHVTVGSGEIALPPPP